MSLGRRRLTAAGLTLCIAAIAGCAITAPQGLSPLAAPPALPAPFALSGRISIAWKAERFIGAVEWDYRSALETVALSISGQDFARFERAEGITRAQLADGQIFEANTWRNLTLRAIGVGLPFDAAPYWIRGLPSPAAEFAMQTNDEFAQDGWRVQVMQRDSNARPTRMRWQREDVSLILIIDAWHTF